MYSTYHVLWNTIGRKVGKVRKLSIYYVWRGAIRSPWSQVIYRVFSQKKISRPHLGSDDNNVYHSCMLLWNPEKSELPKFILPVKINWRIIFDGFWGGNEKFAEIRAGSLSCFAASPLNFALPAVLCACAWMWACSQAIICTLPKINQWVWACNFLSPTV